MEIIRKITKDLQSLTENERTGYLVQIKDILRNIKVKSENERLEINKTLLRVESMLIEESQEEIGRHNKELFLRFMAFAERNIRSMKDSIEKTDLVDSLDLLRSTNSFLGYRNKEKFLVDFPELENQRQYIDMLWAHFGLMSYEEIAGLRMEMIHELIGGH